MNDADSDPARRSGNHAFIRSVSLLFEFDPKEPSPQIWARTTGRFRDAASENQRVQSAQPPNALCSMSLIDRD
jgi:hypothetical protein